MFEALVCYIINVSPKIPKLGKILDQTVREMVQNRPPEDIRSHVESILPDIERLVDCQTELVPLSIFAPLDSLPQQEPLELFSGLTCLNQNTQFPCSPADDCEVDEGTQELAIKRRRLLPRNLSRKY